MIESVLTAAAPAPIGPYSQAIRAGGFLFCSGQIPLDPVTGNLAGEDIETQTRQVLKNIGALLEAASLTFASIVKTTIFLTDMADFPALNAIYAEHFPARAPARSTVAVAALPRGARVEIEVIALLSTI